MSMMWIYIAVAVVACANVVTSVSEGDCVSNGASDIFGVATVVGTTGVVIYDGRARRFLENSDVVASDNSNCDDAYRPGQCACTLTQAPGFAVKDGSVTSLMTIPADRCFETITKSAEVDLGLIAGMDHVRINSSLNVFLMRTDTGVDPTTASCSLLSSAAECTDDVIADSAKCNAVFVQNIPDEMITKGQFRDRCLYGVDDNFKYEEARTFCEDNNLKLVWVEVEDTARKVYEATGLKQYWIGLEKKSGGVWQWVSPDEVVDATSNVDGRWKGANDDTLFDRAVVQGANDNFPLKGLPGTASKNAVCEEQITCTGYRTTAVTFILTLISTTLAKLLLV